MSEVKIKHKGCWLYHPNFKIMVLEKSPTWSVCQIQRIFKSSYAGAELIVDYARSVGVLGFGKDRYNRYQVLTYKGD